jgi:hypothetical protein
LEPVTHRNWNVTTNLAVFGAMAVSGVAGFFLIILKQSARNISSSERQNAITGAMSHISAVSCRKRRAGSATSHGNGKKHGNNEGDKKLAE